MKNDNLYNSNRNRIDLIILDILFYISNIIPKILRISIVYWVYNGNIIKLIIKHLGQITLIVT